MAPSMPPIAEIDVLWITAGLGCDAETVALTGATQPSLEGGQDKPLKYPHHLQQRGRRPSHEDRFAPQVEFDRQVASANIGAVRPSMRIVKLSAKTGERPAPVARAAGVGQA
jgi:Ni2+-binding GTPase involved in maturation of urease and hydrogenase